MFLRLGTRMECSLELELAEPIAPEAHGAVAFQRPIGVVDWATASGRQLRHVVYSLIGCPPMTAATYLLVRRSADGNCRVLTARATRSMFPRENLAHIRRAGARLGANEVHLFCGAKSNAERGAIVADVCRAHGLPVPPPTEAKKAGRSARSITTLKQKP